MSKIPEWFQMTAGDNEPETPKHKFAGKSRLKLVAIATVPLIIAGGALVFADRGAEDDLPALNKNVTATASIKQSNNKTKIQTPSNINIPTQGHLEDGDHQFRDDYDGRDSHEDHGFGDDD